MDSIGNFDNIWLIQKVGNIDFLTSSLPTLNTMTMNKPQPNPPVESVDEIEAQQLADAEQYDRHTPDSYDPHIIPAETAARKEREGENFKKLPKHPAGSESLDTTAGFTVDKEGLVDNFGIEPEMYYATPGDVPESEQLK
jgi:hypothetical protein